MALRLPPIRAALALGALALAACGTNVEGGEDQAPEGGPRKVEAPKVLASLVEVRPMTRYLETTTKIESEREISIHPEAAGIVVALMAEEGDAVDSGDVLCELEREDAELALRDAEVALKEARDALEQPRLDRAEAEVMLASAELSFEQAERDHERDQRLFEDTEVASPVSKQKLEASRLAMGTAKSERDRAKIALEQTDLADAQAATAVARAEVALARATRALAQRTVRAPFAGTVATRSVRQGQNVGPADALFVLTDTANIRAVFYRAQEELELFRPGAGPADGNGASALTFEASTEALPGAAFRGRVQRISPTIDRDSGQFRVTGVFDEPPERGAPTLLPGMLVRLRIATDSHAEALVVHKRAVRREGEVAFVLRIGGDQTVERIAVREGFEDEDLVEVVPLEPGALAAGDRIVAVGSRDLEDGDRVEVEAQPSAALGPDGSE